MTTKNIILVSVGAVVSIGAGFAAGYFVGQKITRKQDDEIIDQMNAELNEYARHFMLESADEKVIVNGTDYSKGVAIHNGEASKKADEMKEKYFNEIRKNGYGNFTISDEERAKIKAEVAAMSDEEKDEFMSHDEDDEERQRQNEAAGLESDEQYEARTHGEEDDAEVSEALERSLPPYMIDEQDYMAPQYEGFTKTVFTYFSDGTLIDDQDDIVPNADDLVGLDNLIEFESGDKDRIFVRNETYAADYEILYKEMTYKEFMGF